MFEDAQPVQKLMSEPGKLFCGNQELKFAKVEQKEIHLRVNTEHSIRMSVGQSISDGWSGH